MYSNSCLNPAADSRRRLRKASDPLRIRACAPSPVVKCSPGSRMRTAVATWSGWRQIIDLGR